VAAVRRCSLACPAGRHAAAGRTQVGVRRRAARGGPAAERACPRVAPRPRPSRTPTSSAARRRCGAAAVAAAPWAVVLGSARVGRDLR